MEISEKILNFKFHILISFACCLFIFFICYLAPSFLDIVKYFWPLFVSTAMFLFAIVVFSRISPPPDSPSEKAGEGLLDFVAGETEPVRSILEEPQVQQSVSAE